MMNIKIFFMAVFFLFIVNLQAIDKVFMNENTLFEDFLEEFIPKVAQKEKQLNQALWILETTGSKDAADLVASLDNELKLLFSDETVYEKLIAFKKQGIKNPLLKRELHILLKDFKANMLPKDILKKISFKEADLAQTYANFRAQIDGKKITENEIREILKKDKSIEKRKKAWEASKEVGKVLCDKIVELVKFRNEAAKHLGYDNYFVMKLDLNDIHEKQLFQTFEDFKSQTDASYKQVLKKVLQKFEEEFHLPQDEVSLWAWKDPFCQSDPIESDKLNTIFEDKNILEITKTFYEKMGFDVESLIQNSDLYEREGKNQHAFCVSMDRAKDVRTLNNIKPDVRWLDTLLHEFGHGVYDLSIDMKLPWLLRSPPHVLTTEAIALLMGRQVYTPEFLYDFCNINDETLFEELKQGHKRRQLFFSRSVFLITDFEKQMYENPNQDLNDLWWALFEKYYYLPRPKNRENQADWAAKYHIGLAPVYYYSYLLGEVFASSLQKELNNICEGPRIWQNQTAKFLIEKMFSQGSRYKWDDLIEHVTNNPFSSDAWVEECNN